MDDKKCYDRHSDTQVIEKNVIRYKKDQWSPLNMNGKKCYDRDFLITLQSNPKCKKKPDNLPDLEVVLKDTSRARMDPHSYILTRPSEVLMPAYHKSSSQRSPLPRETENAWRPARLVAIENMTEDEVRTAELYNKVRGVLNELTTENFERLLNTVRALSIDNEERLQGVIDLVFEKAVDEPNFSDACALMSKELALMQVPANTTKSNKEEQKFVNFRNLLITRCQIEFEKNLVDENARNLKVKEIDDCMDPEKKKDLQALLEEEDRGMRVKTVGNIRFIGELFKQQMITIKIILRCINILLDNKDEDSLECLCTLFTTVGKDLELTKNQNLQSYFNTMQEIVDKEHGKISSRVRFMLQDVIDLRNSKWVPRRQDLNPKTMEQIQKKANTEQLNIQVMNSGPVSTPRKNDYMGDEITLGSKGLFGNWSLSSMKTPQPHATITNTANMYAALENIAPDQEKKRVYETVAALLANDEFIDKLVDNVTQRLDKKFQEITFDYKILKERLDQQEQNFRRNCIHPAQIDRCQQTGMEDFSSKVGTTLAPIVPQQSSSQPTSQDPTNKGPTIRGMTQSGPPNQSSTPPQNDINKMHPSPPGQLQMTFMPEVRSAQSNYFRPPAPNQGSPRMSNHNGQTMTSTAVTAPPMYSQHMTLYPTGSIGAPMTTYQVPLQNYAQRPYYTTQPYPASILPSQYLQGTPIQMPVWQGLPPVPARNAPSPQQQKPVMFAPAPVSPKRELNPKQLKLRMQNIMEEYLNDCCTLKECESDIKAKIDKSKLQEFVIEGYNRVLERSATTRRKAGKLFAYLTKNQTLSNDDMCKALTEVLSQADDLVIDMPKLWDYLAEMILPLVAEGVVPLDKLRSCSDVLVPQGHAHKLIASLLKLLVADNGPNYVSELWKSAGVQFTDFMSADIVDTYVKENNFDFLLGSWNQVHSKLLQFFKSNTTLRTVTDWIYANVGDRVKENQFIRTLVTAIVENAVHEVNGVMKLRSEVLAQHYLLLQRFVDNQERRELQCLFALQALVHKWKHPPGLLLSIFERFWEDGLLSNDSLHAWEKCTDPAEQEGKGIALKSVQSLFTSLKEFEGESGSSTSDKA